MGPQDFIPRISKQVKKVVLLDHHRTAVEYVEEWKAANTLPDNCMHFASFTFLFFLYFFFVFYFLFFCLPCLVCLLCFFSFFFFYYNFFSFLFLIFCFRCIIVVAELNEAKSGATIAWDYFSKEKPLLSDEDAYE